MLRSTPRPRLLRPGTRRGLTLIELLVVILIIGILMGILIPAVAGAMRAAKQAQVTTELSNMATALADFKNKFGDYPPSRLYCAEDGDYSPATGDSADLAQLKQRSLRYLRKFFPRMEFKTNPAALDAKIFPQGYYDFNGNGKNDSIAPNTGAYILNGPECLVLFLGGVPQPIFDPAGVALPPVGYAMVGFAKNPTNPFRTDPVVIKTLNPTITPEPESVNRISPLYEFANNRLDGSSGRGVPVYLDPIGSKASTQAISEANDKRPYAYFNSYGGSSYDPNDYNADYELDESLGSNVKRSFYVNFLPAASLPIASAGPNPYSTSAPIGGTKAAMTTATFANPESFQLLSAGIDRKWGIGGQFSGSGNARLPWDPANASAFYDATPYVSPTPPGNPRLVEGDNLTNFSGGRLD